MAIWQTGVSWAPPLELLSSDLRAALRHVATHFAQLARQLARAVTFHKSHPDTEKAIRFSYGVLNAQERKNSDRKKEACKEYYKAAKLFVEDQEARGGKGKGKKKYRTNSGAAEHTRWPRSYYDMSRYEQNLVWQYNTGVLYEAMRRARARCKKVEAPRFQFRV